MRGNMAMVFVIMLVLVMLAYSAGLVSDIGAFTAGSTRIINALTGRNAAGNFAAFPGNAPGVVAPATYQ